MRARPECGVAALVRRVRRALWLGAAVRLLTPALWISTLMIAVGALARWRLGAPGPAALAAVAALPVLIALGLALTRRPASAEAALIADRRLGAEALLVSAWHLTQDEAAHPQGPPGGRSNAGPLVLARARRAAQDWARNPGLAPRITLPWTPILVGLAALPLLGLSPATDTITTAAGSDPRPGQTQGAARPQGPAPSPLAQAIAALGQAPGSASEATREPGPGRDGGAPSPSQPQSSSQPGPDRHTEGQGTPGPAPSQTQAVAGPGTPPDSAPQAAGPMALAGGPGAGGRDGAGVEAMPRQPGQAGADPAGDPGLAQTERRIAVPRRPGQGLAEATDFPGAPLADPGSEPLMRPQVQAQIPAAEPPIWSPSGSPPQGTNAASQGLSPAQRALVARYFALTQEATAP